jgi:hypothetical protein
VSLDLFAAEVYIMGLAELNAVPEPTLLSRRALDAWLTRIVEALPKQLAVQQT